MDSNLQTSPPDNSEAKAAFRKPSNDASNRQYRRRSPVSRLSSPEGSSQRDRSVSPMVSRDDLEKGADIRTGRDRREIDRDSSRNQYSKNSDSYRYSDRHSSRSSHGYSRHDDYVRHDKRADEDRKYDRLSSRSGRDARVNSHSDHPRKESDRSRSKDYSRADKYSYDRYDGSGHRSRDKEKESPSLEHQKYKDKDSSFDRVGSGKRHDNSIFEEMNRDRRWRDRVARDEKGDYHRSSGDRKGDYTASHEQSKSNRTDSSTGRERDNDKYRPKEGYKSGLKDVDGLKPEKERIKYEDGESNLEKERYGRFLKEESEEKSIYESRSEESPAKKSKLFGSADEKQSNLEQADEIGGRVTGSNDVDITNDLNAAKVAAMKAAELVNQNLIGAGHSNLTTEQKKKLLWGSKKSTPAEESGHHWDTAIFGDRERQEKFNKLMGVKGDVRVEHKPDKQDGSGLLQAEKQREMQLDLEKQYTAGLRRRDGRTVGLGL